MNHAVIITDISL